MRQSETLAELFKALSKAQGEMPAAPKDAKNDHLRNTYATLGSIIATAQPVLARHGLGYTQMAGADEPGFMTLTTRIFHESGEWIEETMRAAVPASKLSEIQSAGSVLSYMRRYSLASALGISTEDDDGQAASAPRGQQKAQQPTPRPQSAPAPTQPPTGTLSAEKAQALHKQLGVILTGTPHAEKPHSVYASEVIRREVESLTELSTTEARAVYEAAQAVKQAAA